MQRRPPFVPCFSWIACLLYLACTLAVPGRMAPAADPATSRGWNDELQRPISVLRNVPYREVAGHQLRADVYRPDDQAAYPLVLMIHGGAWSSGDKWNLQDHARELAQAGFVAVSINYRLAPAFQITDQIADCRAALQWAVGQCGEWRADPDRVCLWGYSAGAHLAALLATQPVPGQPELKAVVAGGAPCEFSFISPESRVLTHVMGGTREQVPETYDQVSPLTHASDATCPMFFFHGTHDLLVPASSSQKLFRELQTRKVASEYYRVDGGGHLLTFLDQTARRKAIEFFRKHCKDES